MARPARFERATAWFVVAHEMGLILNKNKCLQLQPHLTL